MFNFSSLTDDSSLLPFHKEKENFYRLRHLNTGRLVIDQEINYNGTNIITLGLSPHCEIQNLERYSEKNIDSI